MASADHELPTILRARNHAPRIDARTDSGSALSQPRCRPCAASGLAALLPALSGYQALLAGVGGVRAGGARLDALEARSRELAFDAATIANERAVWRDLAVDRKVLSTGCQVTIDSVVRNLQRQHRL